MTKAVSDSESVRAAVSFGARFRRSANIERDRDGTDALDGYLLTGRALDTIRRVARAAATPDAQRSFSVIGPYGSGKSSMALYLDALFGPTNTERHQAAVDMLADRDPDTAENLDAGRTTMGANGSGFVPAVVVADREPITATVWRALSAGADRFGAGPTRIKKQIRRDIADKAAAAADPDRPTPPASTLRDAIRDVTKKAPVLLVIDEFGKNLEEFASSSRDGDLYLLQQLAEWCQGDEGLPLLIITIQHLAFDQYVTDATTAQRREWAKVQGRFEEVAFHDTAATTRSLIRGAINHNRNLSSERSIAGAAAGAASVMRNIGVADLADIDAAIEAYPLHPTTLAVLPDLCARYGQNERTLFSFIASGEPSAVPSLIDDWQTFDAPWVRPHHVYDYFVEASTTFVSASSSASRWVEVEARIREAHAITDAQMRVLKTVGTLNLVSTGGPVRASTAFVTAACADDAQGTATAADVEQRLDELKEAGLLVHRDFADEWRLWEGSDFNVSDAVERARRRTEQRRVVDVVSSVRSLPPVVAARHSYQRRTVRAFSQRYADGGPVTAQPADSEFDGTVVTVLGDEPAVTHADVRSGKPVLFVHPAPDTLEALRVAAVEVAAIESVLADEDLDRVAHRELAERLYQAQIGLDTAAADLPDGATWTWVNPPNDISTAEQRRAEGALSNADDGTEHLSVLLDIVYPDDAYVPIHNEIINRHQLTSQGARTQKLLLGALIEQANQNELGLKPGSAEHSLYLGTIELAGGHRDGLTPPDDDGWKAAHATLRRTLQEAASTGNRITAAALLDALQSPPHGMRAGAATVVLTHFLLLSAGDVALFQHGTFQPALTAPHIENLVRNPHNFAFRYVDASGAGSHTGRLIRAISDALGLDSDSAANRSIVPVAARLVRAVAVPHTGVQRHYIHKTTKFQSAYDDTIPQTTVDDATAVRDTLIDATDPIGLILTDLPAALGHDPVVPGSPNGPTDSELADIATRLSTAVRHIETAYDDLCRHITEQTVAHTAVGTVDELRDGAADLVGEGTTSTINRFAVNATKHVDEPAYGAGLGQSIHPNGTPVNVWSDGDVAMFASTIRRLGPEYRRDLAMVRTRGTDAKLIQVSNGQGPAHIAVVSADPALVEQARAALATAMSQQPATLASDDAAWQQAMLAALAALVADSDTDTRRTAP